MKKILIVFLLINITSYAQIRHCGSNIRLDQYLKNNSIAKKERVDLEKKINTKNRLTINNTTIPVVVHIVYKNTVENISDAQIESQIDVLNDDFTRSNVDAFNTPVDFLPIVADMQITFCLAKQNPDGLPTSGIVRKQTNNSFFPLYGDAIFYDSLGGSNAWNTEKYLNIWVCAVEDGILGWAQFPAGGNQNTDGVVIDFENFGTIGTVSYPYNKGRTATHEIGHWFNLFHLWGDNNCGDDFVFDTPEQEEANYGCKIHPHISCNNNGDMFMNFMDYTNDACMNSFTEGQKNRLWSTLNTYRSGILNSDACSSTTITNSDAGIKSILYPNTQNNECVNPLYPIVIIKNYGSNTLNSAVIKYRINGNAYQYQYWSGSLNPTESDTVLLSGIIGGGLSNIFDVTTESPNNSIDINTSNDAKSLVFSANNGRSVNIELTTDNYAHENSWKLINKDGDIIDSNDSLTSNSLYKHNYCLENNCYYFIINDVFGDGFCCNYGNGNYIIKYDNSNIILGSGNQFTFSDTAYFCINTVITEEVSKNKITIFPNPNNGIMYVNYTEKPIFVEILNMLGSPIQSFMLTEKRIDLSTLKNGIYQLILNTKEKQITKKIIIQK